MLNFIQDLRYALRTLRRSPGFAAVALVTLALGIGASTAIFSVVHAVLLRPLPYKDPARLVFVWGSNPRIGREEASLPDFTDWRAQSTVFEGMAGLVTRSLVLTSIEEPERIPGAGVTANFFSVVGVEPVLGRGFRPQEDRPGGERVAILSHGAWERRFGADPKVIGKSVTLSEAVYTVVGVLPRGFRAPNDTEVWTPMALAPAQFGRRNDFVVAIARLKRGVSLERAQAEMTVIAKRLEREYPGSNTGWTALVVPLHADLVKDVRLPLLVLLGAVGFVLLIACANVANLLLARAAARRREIAVRAALGAGRARLVGQLLTESVMLALAGGGLGAGLATWGIPALLAAAPAEMPRLDIGIDAPILIFTLAISLLTSVVFGLAPALDASRLDLTGSLKEGGRGSTAGAGGLRGALVAAEIALSLVLLIGAGLLLRSFWRLQAVPSGFRADNVLTMRLLQTSTRFSQRVQLARFYEQVLERTARLPGVVAAGLINAVPLSGSNTNFDFTIDGRPPLPPGQNLTADFRVSSPDYFRVLGIPLIQGRLFTAYDHTEAPPVAIINEASARRHFPGQDPLGQRIRIDGPPREIVGVVGNVRHESLASGTKAEIYVSYQQSGARSLALVVRTEGDPLQAVGAVRSQVRAVDQDVPVFNVRSLQAIVEASLAQRRFTMMLLAMFASVALLLAAVGIYGVVSYVASLRTHEFGVRLALGARPVDVAWLVLRQGLVLVTGGVAAGLAAAVALARLIGTLLYGVSATDALTFGAVSAMLAAVALAALYFPARRATQVDPLVALRYE